MRSQDRSEVGPIPALGRVLVLSILSERGCRGRLNPDLEAADSAKTRELQRVVSPPAAKPDPTMVRLR